MADKEQKKDNTDNVDVIVNAENQEAAKQQQELLDQRNFKIWNVARICCAVVTFTIVAIWAVNIAFLDLALSGWAYYIITYGLFGVCGYMTWQAKQEMMKLDDVYAEKNGYFDPNDYVQRYPKEERRRREAAEKAKKDKKREYITGRKK